MARKIEVEIVGDARSLKRAMGEADRSTGKLNSRFGSAKKAAIGFAAGGLGLLAVGLEKSVHQAIDAEASQARLDQAFKNAGISAKKHAKDLEEAEAAGRKLGFTDDQVRQSLGSLIVSTGSYTQAARQMAIAQDLARFKSTDLETATKALTMAHAGSTRALKQLGIDIPKVTTAQDALKAATKDHTTEAYKNELAVAKLQDKQATFANVLDTVTNKVHGQAKAYSQTAAGAIAQFHAQVIHLEEELGKQLLPVLVQIIAKVNELSARIGPVNEKLQTFEGWMHKIGADKSGIEIVTELGHTLQRFYNSDFSKPLRQMVSALVQLAKWANEAKHALDDLLSTIGKIPGSIHLPHIPSVHVPHLGRPGRAAGGPVSAMSPYIVGERGPELFVPGASGSIIPNHQLGGSGPSVINLMTPDVQVLAKWLLPSLKNQGRVYDARNARPAF